jgi:hypothetical protein
MIRRTAARSANDSVFEAPPRDPFREREVVFCPD